MMRKLILLGVFILAASSASAQIRFDTLSTRPIGPGITLTHIVEHTQPWNMNVVEVDLTNPYIQMRAMAGNDRVGGRETVGSMAQRQETDTTRVVAAINADFFSTSWPVATHVQEGEMAYPPVTTNPQRPGVAFSATNQVSMEHPIFSGSVSFADTTITIDGVNRTRQSGEVVLYNQYRGASTATSAGGSELVLRAIDGWAVNDTVRAVVDELRPNSQNTSIPKGGAVLSAHGEVGTYLTDNLAVDDTLELFLGATPGIDDIREMVSGGPFIVRDGKVDVGPRGDGVQRHPRSAAGINEDGTRLYLITVDGRQSASAGMTLTELAEWMVSVGIDRGMNLDGGGSSTLIVYGEVENMLQTGQRAVANGLAVISTAPLGEITRLQAQQRSVRLFRGHQVSFDIDAVDEHNHPIELDPEQLQFEVDEHVGTISSDGVLTAGNVASEGHVYITYGSHRDTVDVVVTDIGRLAIRPGDVLIDTTRSFQFTYQAFDTDGRTQLISSDEVAWSVEDEEIGVIDDEGRFTGLRAGITNVILQYREVTDSARVQVETIYGVHAVDDFSDPDAWEIEFENVNTPESNVEFIELSDDEIAARINYSFVQGTASVFRIVMRRDILVPGVPTGIHADVKTDGLNHRVFFELEDAAGTRVNAFVPRFITETEFDSLAAPAVWSTIVPPLTVRGVGVQLGNTGVPGALNEGSIEIKNLRVSYPPRSTVDSERGAELPAQVELDQNFPNPFNPATTIRFSISRSDAVTLRVYDVLGRLVDTLVDGEQMQPGSYDVTWQANASAGLASGVYYYVLETEGRRLSRAMVLLK